MRIEKHTSLGSDFITRNFERRRVNTQYSLHQYQVSGNFGILNFNHLLLNEIEKMLFFFFIK